jgi:hypothetical protein
MKVLVAKHVFLLYLVSSLVHHSYKYLQCWNLRGLIMALPNLIKGMKHFGPIIC